ncbi:sigma-54 interaction domain-containing protein [Alkaliphilus hydrothermalis]|uniref:Arginine utilization regulatory protein n=1 Tax=Alkaliphilus hydrothermalis TaxID=1482730 RepID=A0ABS2NTB0_9FIRM|nr:sigma 54-interacting transcriptional regulator [Alkaliphilus hydrothermalis]MBM7616151.1 arginine utilization regulatory protein [Alkaliphilus hydrothermalis]
MQLYNIIMVLDSLYRIVFMSQGHLDGDNHVNEKFIGKHVLSFIDIDLNTKSGTTLYNNLPVKYTVVDTPSKDGFIAHISNAGYHNVFYQKILDLLDLGIHIVDKSGYILFTNRAAEKGEFLNRRLTTGKHISDVYPLTTETSCILRALKSKQKLLDIYDTFVSNYSDQTISSINSGYPIFIDDVLVGGLSIVRFNKYLQGSCKELAQLNNFVKKGNDHKQKSYYKNLYYNFDDLIGEDEEFKDSVNLAKRIAKTDTSVLIYGETGTGKELFAQSIHSESKRCENEFIAINCAALPEGLVESILFGTEKGSFTGSINKSGLLEKANKGTLFLDEINSMSLTVQSKLLRVLQEKKYMKVGGTKEISCDVRIISSTNESPQDILNTGKIRLDLYYRINTITIYIPSLRERRKDISILYNHFINKIAYGNNFKTSNSVLKILESYDWPGNVRELLHTVEYSINVCEDSYITTRDIPQNIIKYNNTPSSDSPLPSSIEDSNLSSIMSRYEKSVIQNALKKHNYNISETAIALGLFRQGLQYRIRKYNLSLEKPQSRPQNP